MKTLPLCELRATLTKNQRGDREGRSCVQTRLRKTVPRQRWRGPGEAHFDPERGETVTAGKSSQLLTARSLRRRSDGRPSSARESAISYK